MTRAGIVTVAGKPNAGKSTLLNRVVGEKLAIVSPKPQSTRDRVVGIHTEADTQLVLLDTPGLIEPRYQLQRAMRGASLDALADADIILYVVDGLEGPPASLREVAGLDQDPKAPVVVAINKCDRLSAERRSQLERELPGAFFISAVSGSGVDVLLEHLGSMLPESPFLYPEDEISTQPVRFFVSELIRETAIERLDDELPYSVACEIEEFREGQSPVYIRAVLHVERDSQKRILIGAGGKQIRDIGRAARGKIEALVGAPVYLDLWIKVLHNWRRNAQALQRFGYQVPEERSS